MIASTSQPATATRSAGTFKKREEKNFFLDFSSCTTITPVPHKTAKRPAGCVGKSRRKCKIPTEYRCVSQKYYLLCLLIYYVFPIMEGHYNRCLLYTSPSPRHGLLSRMPSSA